MFEIQTATSDLRVGLTGQNQVEVSEYKYKEASRIKFQVEDEE